MKLVIGLADAERLCIDHISSFFVNIFLYGFKPDGFEVSHY